MREPLKITTVVGARPQFIKAAAVSREIATHYKGQIEEKIIHTGQHFDTNMSKVFFDDLEIPQPDYHFAISGGHHGVMTGKMLEAIEGVLLRDRPDCLLIYGDTNSTLAGALAASKLHIPVAHVEAGLRSLNMRMPEEVNRILSDRISSFLFCPTMAAVENLSAEGINDGVFQVGDVMYDIALFYKERAQKSSHILGTLGLKNKGFALATCHRAENTDHPQNLENILTAFSQIAKNIPLVLPLHPRTKKTIAENRLEELLQSIIITEPLPFLDMIALEQSAKIILTDSGGVQKEAFFYKTPCITLRDQTEWVETVALGWNRLVGADPQAILEGASNAIDEIPTLYENLYGDGKASQKICDYLLKSTYS
jgi:UDP-GlcNAc3NAcA epimerase